MDTNLVTCNKKNVQSASILISLATKYDPEFDLPIFSIIHSRAYILLARPMSASQYSEPYRISSPPEPARIIHHCFMTIPKHSEQSSFPEIARFIIGLGAINESCVFVEVTWKHSFLAFQNCEVSSTLNTRHALVAVANPWVKILLSGCLCLSNTFQKLIRKLFLLHQLGDDPIGDVLRAMKIVHHTLSAEFAEWRSERSVLIDRCDHSWLWEHIQNGETILNAIHDLVPNFPLDLILFKEGIELAQMVDSDSLFTRGHRAGNSRNIAGVQKLDEELEDCRVLLSPDEELSWTQWLIEQGGYVVTCAANEILVYGKLCCQFAKSDLDNL
jgi:hypothetical protein